MSYACYQLNTCNEEFNSSPQALKALKAFSSAGGFFDEALQGVWFSTRTMIDEQLLEQLLSIPSTSSYEVIAQGGVALNEDGKEVFYTQEDVLAASGDGTYIVDGVDLSVPSHQFNVFTYDEALLRPIYIIWEDDPKVMYRITGECFEEHEETGSPVPNYLDKFVCE